MFYELARTVLRKNSRIASKMGLSLSVFLDKLDRRSLSFEECCTFVRVAEDAVLLRYVMEQFGMQVIAKKSTLEKSSGKSLH